MLIHAASSSCNTAFSVSRTPCLSWPPAPFVSSLQSVLSYVCTGCHLFPLMQVALPSRTPTATWACHLSLLPVLLLPDHAIIVSPSALPHARHCLPHSMPQLAAHILSSYSASSSIRTVLRLHWRPSVSIHEGSLTLLHPTETWVHCLSLLPSPLLPDHIIIVSPSALPCACRRLPHSMPQLAPCILSL
jgi:hypothetical protein